MAPSLFFTLLLLCRLVVYYQVRFCENWNSQSSFEFGNHEYGVIEIQCIPSRRQVTKREKIMEEERLLNASREKESQEAQTPATKERGGSWQNEPPPVKKESKKNRRKVKKEE